MSRENTIKDKKRGGGVKVAPPGFYTRKEACEVLGMNGSTFDYHVRTKKIKKWIPPMKKEGYYSRKAIDALAIKMELYLQTLEVETTEVRVARPEDADGVVAVLSSMDWPHATAQQRRAMYEANPMVDFIVVSKEQVAGYIHAAPYTQELLEDMMAGRKHGWDVKPEQIMPYKNGRCYDLYIGIAVRKDNKRHVQLSARLISGFFTFLEELAQERHITIRRLYAVSDQTDGMKLSNNLGFVRQPAQDGDAFYRYMLDLHTSESRFAQIYRRAIKQ